MAKPSEQNTSPQTKPPGIMSLLKPYYGLVVMLLLLALVNNAVNLWLPKMSGHAIDDYIRKVFNSQAFILKFGIAVVVIFIFSYLQSIIQTYASEKVARDLRSRLSDKISKQSNAFVEQVTPSKLLTNLTADVDSIKLFISQAIVSIVSSLFIIIGASVLLVTINWRLALCVIA